jgi:hypothetical protein
MAEKGADVTQEEVDLAYKAFLSEGEPDPSVRAVLKRIGRGSNGTILKMLKIAKATYKEVKTTTLSLPVEIQQVILRAMDKEVAEARAALETELGKTRQDCDDLADDNERQANEIKKHLVTIAELEARLQQQLGVNSQLEKAVADAKQQAEETRLAAEKEIDLARDEATREVETAKAETDRIRVEAEAARTELAKALLRLEALPRLEKESDQLREELRAEAERRHAAERDAAVSKERSDGLDKMVARIPDLETRLQKEAALRASAEQSLALCQQKSEALATQVESLGKATELRHSAEQRAALLEQKVTGLEEKVATLTSEHESRISRTTKEIESRLGTEKDLAVAREVEKQLALQQTVNQQAEKIREFEKTKK